MGQSGAPGGTGREGHRVGPAQGLSVSSVRETGPERHGHSPALDVKNRRKGAKATAERSCGGNTQGALDPGQWQERCLLLYSTLFSVCGDVRNDKKDAREGP